MFQAAARWMIRRNIAALNTGDYGPVLRMFAPDATLAFPGDNTWSRQFGEPQTGTEPSPTHRGRDQIEAFLVRYTDHHIQMEVEDIVVSGPPWAMRAAARVHDWIVDERGERIYGNRAMLYVRTRWGKIVEQEDYEDCTEVLRLEERLGYRAAPALT
jgi:ketosteroid isomerase-like protein